MLLAIDHEGNVVEASTSGRTARRPWCRPAPPARPGWRRTDRWRRRRTGRRGGDRAEPSSRRMARRPARGRSATAPRPAAPEGGAARTRVPGLTGSRPRAGRWTSSVAAARSVVSTSRPPEPFAPVVPLPSVLVLDPLPPLSSWRPNPEAGHALAERLGERVGQALGAVEHDHLVDVAERLGRRLDDRRPASRPAAGR